MTTTCLVPGVDSVTAKFPSSFYAVDVHAAFNFQATNKLTLEKQFKCFFQLLWKQSTFYWHKARWRRVPQYEKDKAVAAGYTEGGLYSIFSATHIPKDESIQAA